MTLRDVIERLGLRLAVRDVDLRRPVDGGYASDLLSDVVANAKEGDVWVTLQTHENIVAVASLRDLAGIVLVGGREPDAEALKEASARKVPIAIAEDRTFEVVARLIEAGVPRRGAS